MRFLGTLALTCALTFGLAVGASAQGDCDWGALVDDLMADEDTGAVWILDDFGQDAVDDAVADIEVVELPDGETIDWTVTFEDWVHVVGSDCTRLLDDDDNPWWIVAWDQVDGVTYTYPDDVFAIIGSDEDRDLVGGGRGNGLGDNGPYGLFIAVGPGDSLTMQAVVGSSGPNLSLNVEGATFAEEGGDITMTANGTMSAPFQWKLDGVNIGGETNATLSLSPTVIGDSGVYTLDFDDGAAKATVTSNPVSVAIFPAGSLPVAGLIGLGLLAAVGALGGASVLRKKN